MKRILLATYLINIENKKGEQQLLSKFNTRDDFLDFLDNFFSHIYQNIDNHKSQSGDSNLHLTLSNPHFREEDNRCIYGLISTGVSGEEYKMVNLETNDVEMEVNENHAAFKDLFFYFYIPKNKKSGYLVLQRRARYGAKILLTRGISSYLKKLGYMESNYRIGNILHDKVYRKMMEFGKLKQVDLIKKRIPNDLEKYIQNGEQPDDIKGSFITTFKSRSSLPQMWKNYLDKLFRNSTDKDRYLIDGLDSNYSEIDFKLELNGKSKTFHLVNKNRIQPDIDVTADVDLQNGVPTIASMVLQSRELIKDLLEVNVQ